MTVPALTDPQTSPTYAPTAFQRRLEAMLYEPRDVVFVRHTLLVLALMVPLQVALFTRFSWPLALLFAGVWAWLAPRTILMLHNTMHRPFFRRPRWLNRVHPYAMSWLFGIPTGYMEHHIGAHHAENNLRADLSSTMKYERDNLLHWLAYFGHFLFLSHVELTRYLVRKRRGHLALRAMLSDFTHVALMVVMFFVDARAALVALLLPYLLIRMAMMFGNWGQHAFIDPSRPGDSYVNSITCINTPYNRRCFNDGYHIGHHVKQNRHWTELPQDFLTNQARYLKEGCIVFEGIDFFMVSVLLCARRYDVLARHFVRLEGDGRTDQQVMDFLKSRTRPIAADVPEGVVMNA